MFDLFLKILFYFIYNLLKEITNVLIELKNINLYHMDIKPVNILMSKKYIKDLD